MEALLEKILCCTAISEKIAVLDTVPVVQERCRSLEAFLSQLTPECVYILKQLIAIGQWENMVRDGLLEEKQLQQLLEKFLVIDAFYRELGGIIGYHVAFLRFLKRMPPFSRREIAFHAPSFVDITQETKEVWQAVEAGLRALPLMAELYPLGGAADRLHLIDERTGRELPAAKLCFAGCSLLERLVRDLQAREYLYFKLFGVQLTTPLGVMTSEEKENHRHVLQICEDHQWFGRPRDSFRFFMQPLVPTVDEQGNWIFSKPFQPLLKPGGHGAIWKLARDEGIFSWLQRLGRKKALVRQINNPLAGLDYGFLAFTGHGVKNQMLFGFASCPRRIGAAEGINVLVEREGKEVFLSNIEYCDFAKHGIEDLPLKEGEPYSCFSSNTNILFVDLEAIGCAVEKIPYPGLLINLKKRGDEQWIGRLEMTMQNIADAFVEEKKDRLRTERTFITYNHRHKTIATAKKAYLPGHSLQETPENCFYELLNAARELLEKRCAFQLPLQRSLEEVLLKGPEFSFLYHPALGPLYAILEKKLWKGRLALGSELMLEIADLEIKELDLDGSLIVRAEQVMGHKNSEGILRYSSRTGRCTLRNIEIRNRGVDWDRSRPFWKTLLQRWESVEILLKGHSEFIAEGVVFYGSHRIVVEDGMRVRAEQKGDQILLIEEKLSEEEPFWMYRWEDGIQMKRGAASKRLAALEPFV